MRGIKKRNEPNSLVKHRKTKNADYENYPDKQDIREYTCTEQRGVCCYCLGPIAPTEKRMKIEHFKSQSKFPEFQLIYKNLLGACLGNQKQPEKLQHCDTFKGNKKIGFNPADGRRTIQNMIWYTDDGTIGSYHADFNTELNKGLNLNIKELKNKRKAALAAFQTGLSKFNGALKKSTIEKLIADWNGDSNDGYLTPYCQIIVFWLQKYLNRLSA